MVFKSFAIAVCPKTRPSVTRLHISSIPSHPSTILGKGDVLSKRSMSETFFLFAIKTFPDWPPKREKSVNDRPHRRMLETMQHSCVDTPHVANKHVSQAYK